MSFQLITTIGSMPSTEQRRERLARDPVALVLEPVDLDEVMVQLLEAAQPRERLGDVAAGILQHAGQLQRLLHRGLDVVEPHEVGRLLGEVDDVVERRRERVDVLTVDRRHRRAVQPVDDVVGDPVALLLADQDLAAKPARVGPLLHQPAQELGGVQDVRPRLVEEVEELAILGNETESGHGRWR